MIYVLLTSELPWQRNDASIFSTCLCISRYQDFFFRNHNIPVFNSSWPLNSLDPWGAIKEAFQRVLATSDIAPRLQKM